MINFLKRYQLTDFALLLIATLAKFLFMWFLFLWGVIESAIRWELRKYLRAVSYITDVEGNVKGKYFFNTTMRKKGGHDFGDPQESISEAIGRNNRLKMQLKFSKWIEKTLLEPAEKNHCEKAVLQANERIKTKYFLNFLNSN